MLRTGLATLMLMATAGGLHAQEESPIVASIERFIEECKSAMADPAAYFEEARAQGEDSPVAVARAGEENIRWILDMTPPGEFSVHLGEIAGQTRVYCHLGLFNDEAVMDAARTNEEFLGWLEDERSLQHTGGAIDLKDLMAGDAGTTGEAVELTAQVYQHFLKDWSGTGAIASVAVQVGMLELDAETLRPGPLRIED